MTSQKLFLREAFLPAPLAPLFASHTTPQLFSIAPAFSDAFDPNPLDPFGFFPSLYPPIQVAGIYVSGKEATYNFVGSEASYNFIAFGEDLGDSNRYRDQGQVIISSNSISYSSNRGIVVDAGAALRPDLIVPALLGNSGPRPAPGSGRTRTRIRAARSCPTW